ncbi:metadherin a isoform X2 [Gouania willdenowi]|uniref:metadherin a isoform X2 n=1 Tax=Gouania willdenowi TaxID=441366 RepID=UPI0010565911|nr:protein LYRIC-like isoform X2 [Gouania willdenowi]
MAGDLRGLAMEKAEHLSGHLKELLSSGQEYVKARFGLDLGVDPELYPSWVVLSAAAAGLLVLLALSWAAVCGLLDGHKKRRVPVSQAMAATPGKTTEEPEETSKTVRVEEARRKTKKRAAEKRIQSNGQPVSLTQEVVKETEVVSKPPPPPHVKAEKVQEVSATAQVKKNKKKPKPEVKPAQHASTNDRKEPEEGMWETKVSNREKKQLRRKDKGSDDLGSPGSVEAPKQHMEAQTATAHSKKNRGNHESQHPRKAEAAGDAVSSNWKDEATANGPGWSERSLKIPPQMEGGKWSSMPAAVHYRPQSKSQSWTQEAKAAWSDGQMKTDINSASFSMLGLDPKDQISNSCELQWAGHPADDEWSAFNRISAVDPCSDWNAPSEHWGNYEEPLMLGTPAPPLKEKPALNKQILNDNDKEAEDPSDGAAKSKKRRKKKKKTEEEAEADAETVMVVTKPQELPVLSSKTMNSSFSSSSQKKMEPMAETVKSSQRKKIRKET